MSHASNTKPVSKEHSLPFFIGIISVLAIIATAIYYTVPPAKPHTQAPGKVLISKLGITTTPPAMRASPGGATPVTMKNVGEAPLTPVADLFSFRLCALMANSKNGFRAGLIDKRSGETTMLSIGEATYDGWEFVSADYRNETATFTKDSQTCTAKLESGPSPLASAPPQRSPALEQEMLATQSHLANKEFTITPTTLHLDSGEVSISPAPSSKRVALVQTGGKTYSIPSEIVHTMLGASFMTDEQKAAAILSFPALAEVAPGEDPLANSQNATSNMEQSLIPPTNAPPFEELAAITQQWMKTESH